MIKSQYDGKEFPEAVLYLDQEANTANLRFFSLDNSSINQYNNKSLTESRRTGTNINRLQFNESVKLLSQIYETIDNFNKAYEDSVDVFFYCIFCCALINLIEESTYISILGNAVTFTAQKTEYQININLNKTKILYNEKIIINTVMDNGEKADVKAVIKNIFSDYYNYLTFIRNVNSTIGLLKVQKKEILNAIDVHWKYKGYMVDRLGPLGAFIYQTNGYRDAQPVETVMNHLDQNKEITSTLKIPINSSSIVQNIDKKYFKILKQIYSEGGAIFKNEFVLKLMNKYHKKLHRYETSNNAMGNYLHMAWRNTPGRAPLIHGSADNIVVGNLPASSWPIMFLYKIFFNNAISSDIYISDTSIINVPEWFLPFDDKEFNDYETIISIINDEVKKNKTLFVRRGTKFAYSFVDGAHSDPLTRRSAFKFAKENIIEKALLKLKTDKYKIILECFKEKIDDEYCTL